MGVRFSMLACALALGAAAYGAAAVLSPTTTPPAASTSAGGSSARVSGALSGILAPQLSASTKGSLVPATKQYSAPPPMSIDQSRTYTATIDTSLGSMQADLFARDAPITVNNFVFLVRDGYYNGVTFHRVIKDFMAQTGDPTGTGTGGPGYRFNDEKVTRKYERGTLAMANAGPNTNGSQFFIIEKDYPLPPSYTIFGKLSQGLDTLDKIMASPTGPGRGGPNTPLQPITINSITIEEK